MMNTETRGERCILTKDLRSFLTFNYAIDSCSPFIDLGGGNCLNLLAYKNGQPMVARIYRPWVTAERIYDANRIIAALGSEFPTPEKADSVTGDPWCVYNGRIVELEKYVKSDSQMNTLLKLSQALPYLGRFHSAVRDMEFSAAGLNTEFTNYVSQQDCLGLVKKGCARIRSWTDLTDYEKRIADMAETLAYRLEEYRYELPVQMTHGDFWDNNVLFSGDSVVLIGDYDFIGARCRIEDLALTMYFTDAQFTLFDVYSGDRFAVYRKLFSRYHSALDIPWSEAEREAMPYAMARQPLWGIAKWVNILDESAARNHISDMEWYLKWGLSVLSNADQWTELVFTTE